VSNNRFDDESTVVGEQPLLTTIQRGGKPFVLQQIDGPGAPQSHTLELDEIIIGRSVQAHISIESGRLSRKHLMLQRRGTEFTCTDLNSSNGVYLNGVKAHSAVLRDGDTIQIGDVVFVYHEGTG